MRGRARSLSILLLLVTGIAFLSGQTFLTSVAAQSSRLTLGQPVTGTLSEANPEDWYGVAFPRGEVNFTLQIPSSSDADVAFDFSPFVNGVPFQLALGLASTANSQGPGGNETLQLVFPSNNFGLLGFQVPGENAIRVRTNSSNFGTTGSVTYTLTVRLLRPFTSTTLGAVNSFDNLLANGTLIYSTSISQPGAYNVTILANQTFAKSIQVLEGDLYGPISTNTLFTESNMLIVLSAGEAYFIVTRFLTPGPLKGNVTISFQPITTIGPGQTVAGTATTGPVFYLANVPLGSYYNFTLSPDPLVDLRLDLFSPSYPDFNPVATSNSFGNGVVEKAENVAIFYLSSYAFTQSNGYQRRTPSLTGTRPDKVLVAVSPSGPGGGYSLSVTGVAFPTLSPDTRVEVSLSAPGGSFYAFYNSQSGPGAYYVTYPYEVTNSSSLWFSQVGLKALPRIAGTFNPAQLLLNWIITPLLGSTAARDQLWNWVAEFDALKDARTNDSTSAQNSTLRVGFAEVNAQTPYFGVTLESMSGSFEYRGNLTYALKTPAVVALNSPRTDFLGGKNTTLYSVQLVAGRVYRLDASYVSHGVFWAVYDPSSGLPVASLDPFLFLRATTDPSQQKAADYFLITPGFSGTFIVAAAVFPGLIPGLPISGLSPEPEGEYTFTVSEVKSPVLSVSISAPSSVAQGATVIVNGTVRNTGSYTVNSVVVTLALSQGLTTSQALSVTIGSLGPGESSAFSWTVSGSAAGAGTATVTVSSENAPSVERIAALDVSEPAPAFLSSPTGIGVIAGVVAAVAGLALGLLIGRRPRAGSLQAPVQGQI